MTNNPYSDQEPYGQAWDFGYQYGRQNTEDTDPVAPDFADWGLDGDTLVSAQQVWQEGALAGRDDAAAEAGGAVTGESGTSSDLPHYDAETDTLFVAEEEFPALVQLAQAGDIDTWLSGLGVDVSIFADDAPSV